MDEITFYGTEAGVSFKLERKRRKDAGKLAEAVRKIHHSGVRFFVTDLPADVLSDLAGQTSDLKLIYQNASARDDHLRADGCRANMFHVIPSHAMLMDALAQ